MNSYLPNIGKVSKVLLVVLVCFFVFVSLCGICLMFVKGILGVSDSSVGSVAETNTDVFQDLAATPVKVSPPVLAGQGEAFLKDDYGIHFSTDGWIVAIISKVVTVGDDSLSLWLDETDLESVHKDSNVEDGMYRLNVGEADIFEYNPVSGIGKALDFSDVAVGDVVAFYFDPYVIYVRTD